MEISKQIINEVCDTIKDTIVPAVNRLAHHGLFGDYSEIIDALENINNKLEALNKENNN